MTRALACYRTSSTTNVGGSGDSLHRQQEAVQAYAKAARFDIVNEFYDAAVSGADPIDERPGFADLLAYIRDDGIKVVLVEDTSRFARDLAVQLAGHGLLKEMGVELIAANSPEHFRDETPTAVVVRRILGAVSHLEKAQLVRKLRHARDAKRAGTDRCEGRKPVPAEIVATAKRLHRRNPKTGQRPS